MLYHGMCCNTCDDVVYAWRRRGWSIPPRNVFYQCKPEWQKAQEEEHIEVFIKNQNTFFDPLNGLVINDVFGNIIKTLVQDITDINEREIKTAKLEDESKITEINDQKNNQEIKNLENENDIKKSENSDDDNNKNERRDDNKKLGVRRLLHLPEDPANNHNENHATTMTMDEVNDMTESINRQEGCQI